MNKSEENNEYKLLILDRIKDPTRANAVMEVIANNKGDEALALVIAEMETVDVARLFTEAFDYTKPNQAAGLIKADIAADCILSILARRSAARLEESPIGAANEINDFVTAVVLSRPVEKQSEFSSLFQNHIDLFTACIMCQTGYQGGELVNIIAEGEQGTIAEIAKNLGLTNTLLKSVRGAMGKNQNGSESDEDESDADDESFDAASEKLRSNFVQSTLARFHQKAIKKFGAEATTSMDEFMDM